MRPVSIANRHPRLRLDRRSLARAIHVLDAHHDVLATRGSVLANEGELSIVILTDAELARVHDAFLGDPTITDVITFAGDPGLGTAGEICVSPDAAVRHVSSRPAKGARAPTAAAARRAGQFSPMVFARELTLYVVHGWLHLAGYDDLRPDKKRIMRRAEARAMAVLEQANAMPEFRLQR